MNSISQTYINALLADATYVHNIDPLLTDKPLEEKLSDRMTPALAKYVSKNFSVVTQIESGDFFASGFDATVWRENDANGNVNLNGKLYISMRGTEPLVDLAIADADLAVTGKARLQLRDMVNWWLRETAPQGATVRQIKLDLSVVTAKKQLGSDSKKQLGSDSN